MNKAKESGPICPRCSTANSRVVESRQSLGSYKRRRECNNCKFRFITYEIEDSFITDLQYFTERIRYQKIPDEYFAKATELYAKIKRLR